MPAKFGHALQLVDLKNGRGFKLAAITIYFAIRCSFLKDDRDLILAATSQFNCAFKYAFRDLKDDRGFVLAAVTRFGLALQYASEDLTDDRIVMPTAITQFGLA